MRNTRSYLFDLIQRQISAREIDVRRKYSCPCMVNEDIVPQLKWWTITFYFYISFQINLISFLHFWIKICNFSPVLEQQPNCKKWKTINKTVNFFITRGDSSEVGHRVVLPSHRKFPCQFILWVSHAESSSSRIAEIVCRLGEVSDFDVTRFSRTGSGLGDLL